MAWIVLVAVILAEVAGTALKMVSGLTRLVPSVIVAVAYVLPLVLLAFAVKYLQVRVAYAIWSGVGTAAIAVIEWFAFGESLTVAKVGALLIIAGVVILNLTGARPPGRCCDGC